MKIFINSIKVQKTKYDDCIHVFGKNEEIVKELKKICNEKGYINFYISKRKNPTEKESHTVYALTKDEDGNTN